GHLDLHRVVFQRGRIDECLWEDVTHQLGTQGLSLEERLDRLFTERPPGDSAEHHAGVFDDVVPDLEIQAKRRHRKVPHASRSQLLEGSPRARFGWWDHDLREDLVRPDDVRLDSAVDHHVARHELFDRQLLDPGRRRQLHGGVEWYQGSRRIAGVHGVAEPSAHRGVVVAVVADRAITDIAAVPPTGVAAAQVLAPDLL